MAAEDETPAAHSVLEPVTAPLTLRVVPPVIAPEENTVVVVVAAVFDTPSTVKTPALAVIDPESVVEVPVNAPVIRIVVPVSAPSI